MMSYDIKGLGRYASKKSNQEIEIQYSRYGALVQLKKTWTPPGYIRPWDLINAAGKKKFDTAWTGQEFEVKEPSIIVSPTLNLKNRDELVKYGFDKQYIKEHKFKPTSLRGLPDSRNDYDWFYCLRSGKRCGTKTREDAIEGWLQEVPFIIQASKQYLETKARLDSVKGLLRDDLYSGNIKAFYTQNTAMSDVPQNFWMEDHSMGVFRAEKPASNIYFNKEDIDNYLKNSHSKSRVAVVTKQTDVSKALRWMQNAISEQQSIGSKAEWFHAVRKVVPDLSRRQFDHEIWVQCATEEMKAAGPKKKKPS